jgi:predicted AAA+ superfamily ATPase
VLNGIRYRIELRRLERAHDAIEERHKRIAEDSINAGQPKAPFDPDLWEEKRQVYLKIVGLESRYMMRKAARLRVPTPDEDDESLWLETATGYCLSREGITHLRRAIRQEQSERWDLRLKIIGLVSTTSIGTLGALIGLVSALKK